MTTPWIPAGEKKTVIVIREDLNMTPGKMAAQIAHALGRFEKVVVVKVGTLKGLLKVQEKAQSARLQTILVCDAGRTQVPCATATCVAIGPAAVHPMTKSRFKEILLEDGVPEHLIEGLWASRPQFDRVTGKPIEITEETVKLHNNLWIAGVVIAPETLN